MRIFDPKDQLGNSLLSSADTQKSSVKLEKQMSVGGGAITLTSTDISDIENWELSNARVKVDGQMISFLPDTSRDTDGNLVITLGESFSNVVLILKRTDFDGMKQEEEEEITIEVKIQRLMEKTMAAATTPTPRTSEEVNANVAEWKSLGEEAVTEEPENYPYAACSTPEQLTAARFNFNATTIGSDVCLISLETVNNVSSGTRTFPNVQDFGADLPSLKNGTCMFYKQKNLKTFTGKIPNITNVSSMFSNCSGLTEWSAVLPNSLTDASFMFSNCTGLTEWTVALPNTITNAQSMFVGCSGLNSWTVALPSNLTNASGMFSGCYGLTEWTVALPNTITNASGMFNGWYGLTEWTVALPNSLQNASWMFQGCTGLTSFSAALPNSLTDASGMFQSCSGLNSWNGTFGNGLTNASYMFADCYGFTVWTVALPNSITDASSMFSSCVGLNSFSAALPNSITDASQMFYNCSSLTSFQSDMPSGLTNAYGMFDGCRLDKESLQRIANTMPDVKEVADYHTITIGYDSTETTTSEVNDFKNTIALKGWEVTMQSN